MFFRQVRNQSAEGKGTIPELENSDFPKKDKRDICETYTVNLKFR